MKKFSGYFKNLLVGIFIISQPTLLFSNHDVYTRDDNSISKTTGNDLSCKEIVMGFVGHIKSWRFWGSCLTKTNTIGGLKCEHYKNGDTGLRVFYNSKGDYVTILEDKDDFDFEPKSLEIIGPYKLHLNDGIIEGGWHEDTDGFIKKLSFQNGNSLYFIDSNESPEANVERSLLKKGNFTWEDFKKGHPINYSIMDYFKSQFDYTHDMFDFRADCRFAFVRSADPNNVLDFKKHKDTDFNRRLDVFGYKKNNCIYTVTGEGELRVIAKEFDGCYVPCTSTDSIVKLEIEKRNFLVRYANGDMFYTIDGYEVGELHRGDLFIKINRREGKEWARIKYPNGSVFAGSIWNGYDIKHNIPGYFDLYSECWYPWTGELRYPDGRSIAYTRGETEAEREAKQKAAEREQMAKNKTIYDAACKKYGKKYIDAIFQGNIIIGMPEELVVGVFDTRLKTIVGNSKCYRIYGWGVSDTKRGTTISNTMLKKIIWVTNGRVSSIENIR